MTTNLSLDLACAGGSGQFAYSDLCRLTGKHLDADKHSNMSPSVVFAGCDLNMESVFNEDFMILGPKEGRLENISLLIRQMFEADRCTPAQAATLIGKCGFVSSQLQGRFLRFAERPLIERQYSPLSETALSDRLSSCLRFVEEAFRRLPPRKVPMSGDDPLAIIYSDAAFQEGKPISLGWVLFTPSSRPRAGAMEAPQALSITMPRPLLSTCAADATMKNLHIGGRESGLRTCASTSLRTGTPSEIV